MKITPSIARLHAHICGDGHVGIHSQKRSPGSLKSHPRIKLTYLNWLIAYTNTCKILIDEFQNDLEESFNRRGLYYPKTYSVRANGAKHIIQLLELESKNSYNWNIPDFIINSSDEVIHNWIRAFFDDEATVDIKQKSIFVNSVNRDGLIQVSELLKKINIDSHINGPYKNGIYSDVNRLCIKHNAVIKYYDKVSFLHPEKLKKLEIISGLGKI